MLAKTHREGLAGCYQDQVYPEETREERVGSEGGVRRGETL